jgi:hypothetical protein
MSDSTSYTVAEIRINDPKIGTILPDTLYPQQRINKIEDALDNLCLEEWYKIYAPLFIAHLSD